MFIMVVVAACGESSTAQKRDASSSDGDGPEVDGAPPGSFPLTEAAAKRMCVNYGSCLDDGGVGRCFRDLFDPELTSEEMLCVAGASGCAAVRACRGLTITMDASCTTTQPSTCAGNTYVACGGGQRARLDCAHAESTCSASAGCACTPGERCEGSVSVRCSSNIFTKLDCALHGQRCDAASGRCVDDTAVACSQGDPGQCDGTDAIHCGASNLTVRWTCGLTVANTSCQLVGNVAFCGWGNACSYGSIDETCSGSQLTACLNGRVETFDCAAYGFTSCQTTSQGKARCI